MKSYLKRFLNMLRPQLKRALWATLLMLIIVLLQLPLPLFSKFFIDNILPQKSFYLLNVSIIILIIVFIIREGASVLNEYLLAIFREMVIYAMRLKLFQHVQNLNLSFFRKHQTGYERSRVEDRFS